MDYSIRIATREDAVKLVKHMSHRGHMLSTQDISSYAESTIVQALNQLVQVTSLGQGHRELKMHLLSQHMQQYLQESFSIYGITLSGVKVLVTHCDERLMKLISLKAFSLRE